jgi:hypothetical protein
MAEAMTTTPRRRARATPGNLVYFVVIWYILWLFSIFCGFLVFWYILWLFGIFCGYLICFVVIWYILWLFGMLRQDKSGKSAKKRTWRAELWKLIFRVDKSKESKLSQKDERRTFFSRP